MTWFVAAAWSSYKLDIRSQQVDSKCEWGKVGGVIMDLTVDRLQR